MTGALRFAIAGALGGLLLPNGARATNGTRLRTPVVWPEPATCMVEVDRRIDPVVHLAYVVTKDDLDVTSDEVDDSRTHQFFALCRQHSRSEFLPNWVSTDDVTAASAKNLVPDGSADEPEEILDMSPIWAGCFSRVTNDDARVPITVAQSTLGVDWDTSGVAPGPWVIEGYTWEPANNLWSTRPGVVRIFDSDDWADNPPAAGLVIDANLVSVFRDEIIPLDACVRAMPGSTYTAQYAVFPPDDEWTAFAVDQAIDAESFTVEFLPPQATHGEPNVSFRLIVTDPLGRSTIAYVAADPIAVRPQSSGACDEGATVHVGAACLAGTTDGAGEPAATGCRCGSSPTGPLGLLWALAALSWLRWPTRGPRVVRADSPDGRLLTRV